MAEKHPRLLLSKGASTDFYRLKRLKESELGRRLTNAEYTGYYESETKAAYNSGTSIFDPVLCEIAYRWFSPPQAVIIDPFAGGSVRGIVAAKLNRRYIGIDLRAEQIEANNINWQAVQGGALTDVNAQTDPVWLTEDSHNIDHILAGHEADFIFSCPPYAHLEVYSDDPKDLSTMAYAEFKTAYAQIINKSCQLLKNHRFACFVVGEIRDKQGHYYDFIGDTVQAFKDAGLAYYNEIILVTNIGSLPIRAGRQFSVGRKIGKTHQNVLVFLKGDVKKAVAACGEIDISDECFADLET